jgi:SAM-dependent methyltransferase
MALARAIVRFRGHAGPLSTFVEDSAQSKLRVLEINEAGTLNPLLSRLPGHRLLSFPEFDMANLAIPTNAVDLVVHSDTLEHVPDPLKGLRECRRVIDNQGAVIFTVPVVFGRLSRGREGLPPSYHGQRESTDSGMRVHTEFGADVWTFVVRAGFTSCELVPFLFPAGLAVVARP